MVKKGEKLSEEHKRRIGEGVRRQSAHQQDHSKTLDAVYGNQLDDVIEAHREAKQSEWSAEANAAFDNLVAEGVKADEGARREIERIEADKKALLAIQKYIGDLTFVAPEIFPSGQTVQHEVGKILGMWK